MQYLSTVIKSDRGQLLLKVDKVVLSLSLVFNDLLSWIYHVGGVPNCFLCDIGWFESWFEGVDVGFAQLVAPTSLCFPVALELHSQ